MVVCRFRPQNKLEVSKGAQPNVQFNDDPRSCKVFDHEGQDFSFSFDRVFNTSTKQRDVYEVVGKPLLDAFFEGYNSTILSYGQTGAGKTHTMMGPSDKIQGYCDDPDLKGLIPRMAEDIFSKVEKADQNVEFAIKVSYVEIYLERVRDLLQPEKNNLQIHEERGGRGVFIQDVTEVYVSSLEEMFQLMAEGATNRVVASTNMNEGSSRSHSIFVITMSQKNASTLEQRVSKLFLVDLAGSEKVSKTGAAGLLLDEAKMINKSLSTLGNVINALTDGKSSHVPYRDSKLTRLLQDSLGGNARTALCINCSSSMYNDAETISTLRFGQRAKSIKNKATINRQRTPEELQKALDAAEREIEKLQALVAKLSAASSNPQQASAADAKLAELKAIENDEWEAKLRDRDEELSAAKQLAAEFKMAADRAAKESQVLLDKLADTTMAYQKAEQAADERKLECDSLQAAVKSLGEEVSQLQKRVTDAERELQTATAKSEGADDEHDRLRDEVKHLRESLQKQIDDSQWEMAKLDAAAKNKASNLEKQLSESESSRFSLQKQVASLEEQVLEAQRRVSGAGDSNALYEKQLSALRSQLSRAQEDTQALAAELRRAREDNASKEDDFEKLKNALLRDLQNRCQKVIDLELALDEARDQAHKLKLSSNVKTLTKRVVVLEDSIEQVQVALRQSQTENHNLRLELDLAQKKLENRNDRIANLELVLQNAQEEVRELRQERLQQQRGGMMASGSVAAGTSAEHTHTNIYKSIRGGTQRKLSSATAPPRQLPPPPPHMTSSSSAPSSNASNGLSEADNDMSSAGSASSLWTPASPPMPSHMLSNARVVNDDNVDHDYEQIRDRDQPVAHDIASKNATPRLGPTQGLQLHGSASNNNFKAPDSGDKKEKGFWGNLFGRKSSSPAPSPSATGLSRSHSSLGMSSPSTQPSDVIEPINTFTSPASPQRRQSIGPRKAASMAVSPQAFDEVDPDQYQSADITSHSRRS
jgi:kinesin family protein 5